MAKNSKNLDRNTKAELPWAISLGFGLLTLGLSWHLFLVITLTSGVGLVVRHFQQQQKQEQELLNSLFYKLIEENQGHITTLDLAMRAKLPANVVKEFLDRQARDFAAHYEITDQGGVIYYFPTALSFDKQQVDRLNLEFVSHSAVASDLRDNQKSSSSQQRSKDEISNNLQSQKAPKEKLNNKKLGFSSLVPKLLNQVELASRLKVHPSTISKRKTKADFIQWSREKDPEAIAWEYSRETKRFAPRVVE